MYRNYEVNYYQLLGLAFLYGGTDFYTFPIRFGALSDIFPRCFNLISYTFPRFWILHITLFGIKDFGERLLFKQKDFGGRRINKQKDFGGRHCFYLKYLVNPLFLSNFALNINEQQ